MQIGDDEGLHEESAANCHTLFTLPKAVLHPVGHLGPAKQAELERALTVALGLR